ncbi:MAG: polyprenyl synthetase family protein [Candidatus Puniceispirillales bacterium]|jgi:farnesyl diphosphate synthase|nr:polyprenyl synthetase family protein [Alphaproteobacteria bacterium]
MDDFLKKLEDNSYEIDNFLDNYLPFGDGLNKNLLESMRYSAISGGKKIRAFLVLETGKVLTKVNNQLFSEKKFKELVAVASAIEAIHCYSLIHDDLPAMDNSAVRRGKPSNHVKYGDYTAILAGDALLSWAFQIIGDTNFIEDPRNRSDICFVIAKAIGPNGMVGGQQADMDFSNQATLSLSEVEWIQRHKTGALISSCCEVASILVGANEEHKKELMKYADNIGLAFQIADDLLDEDGDETVIGKPTKQDSKNKTPNFVTMLGKEKAINRAIKTSNDAIEIIEKYQPASENLVSLAKYTVNRKY